jgi:hypothetical protein
MNGVMPPCSEKIPVVPPTVIKNASIWIAHDHTTVASCMGAVAVLIDFQFTSEFYCLLQFLSESFLSPRLLEPLSPPRGFLESPAQAPLNFSSGFMSNLSLHSHKFVWIAFGLATYHARQLNFERNARNN